MKTHICILAVKKERWVEKSYGLQVKKKKSCSGEGGQGNEVDVEVCVEKHF